MERPSWRTVAQMARQAATPYVEKAADEARRLRTERSGSVQSSGHPVADGGRSEPASGEPPSASNPENPVVAERAGASERTGRAVGSFAGYTVRSTVGTSTQPVAQKVWHERPDVPTWQKILGAFGWGALILTPHGWIVLAVSFIVMVPLGRYNPYSWAVWVTKWSGIFLAITLILALIVLASAESGSSY